MFAQSPALLFFVAETLRNREPLERFLEFLLVCCYDAGQRGRELRSHGDFAFPFVSEIEKLSDNFVAALSSVEFGRLEVWAIPLDEAIPARDFTPLGKDVIANGAVVREEIAKTG